MARRRFNPDIHHRKSLRFSGRDYSWSGIYYVTICAEYRDPIFEIPELRQILEENWQALPKRFPGVTLDEFIIMPDHVHFILWLDSARKDPPTLGDVVGAYKSLTTVDWLRHIKAAGLECRGQFWQHNYYEHIIDDNKELGRTRRYIRTNPTREGIRKRSRLP